MRYQCLINKNNTLKYKENISFEKIKNINQEDILVEEKTYKSYLELKKYLKEQNIIIEIISARKSIKLPEISSKIDNEEDTGISLSIKIKEESEEKLLKFHSNLWKFGFILRYPKAKEKITGEQYNSSYIRYVEKIPAKIIYENNLTLEEYLQSYGGILYVNKPKGITSFDVVKRISNSLGIKKIGHTGTLDPMATGVMIIAFGQATKIVELLSAEDKEYIATAKLGIKTDTYDITGKILDTKEITTNINIEKVINNFQKTYNQEVPIYSAVKVKGKKLYEYARNNEKIDLPKKQVTIKKIELLEKEKDTFIFKSLVTKGCYIRSLINDIGKELKTYATMTDLIRTKQGKITLEMTNTLNDIENNQYQLHSIEEVLDYKVIIVEDSLAHKLENGQKIKNIWDIKEKVIFKNKLHKLIGIYQKKDDYLVVWKNFQSLTN